MQQSSGRKVFNLSNGATVTWSWGEEALDAIDWREWDAFCAHQGESSVFLESRMMRTLLASPDRPIAALEWRKGDQLVGVAGVEDTCAESVNLESHITSERSWFQLISKLLHGRNGRFQFQVRVVGTVLGSGEHGPCWSSDVTPELAKLWLEESVFLPVKINGNRVPRVVMLKDKPIVHQGQRQERWPGWIPLEFDPEMIFHLDPNWNDFDAYTAALKTKSRTKINRIQTLSAALEIKPWTLQDLEERAEDLVQLYQQVYERSGFRLGSLHRAELVESKRVWKDDFVVNGYYLEGRLCGFQCAYVGAAETEAFFVGFEPQLIKSHGIYQRMLVEFICLGVSRKSDRVNMGRTALEIKSSVGALPRRLQCDVRFRNRLFHRMVHAYTRGYNPSQLSLRQPWKAESYPVRAHSEFHPVGPVAPTVFSATT